MLKGVTTKIIYFIVGLIRNSLPQKTRFGIPSQARMTVYKLSGSWKLLKLEGGEGTAHAEQEFVLTIIAI